MGETVTEGTILTWSKGVGDTVSVDEVLVEDWQQAVGCETVQKFDDQRLEIFEKIHATIRISASIFWSIRGKR